MTAPSKRSNQDSQPDLKAEPASKKAATGTGILIDEQHLLLNAQVALDRLESATASDICTQVSEIEDSNGESHSKDHRMPDY